VRGLYPIQTVSLRTGLSAHAIRAWERRYGVVEPVRREGRRLYSEADVVRLSLLKRAVDAGHRIGTVASFTTEELRTLLSAAAEAVQDRELSQRVARAVEHATATDARKFDAELYDAVRTYGDAAVVESFIFPVLREIGSRWREGTAEIAEEHVVTAVIRSYLSSRLRDLAPPADAPVVVFASLEGELHDIGGLAGAVRAQAAGWHATFLGANTPPDSIAHVAGNVSARAVVVVVTMEESDASISVQLERLVAGMPTEATPAIAGHISAATAEHAARLGIAHLRSMGDLDEFLAEITRSSARADRSDMGEDSEL
jgi:DNA-binding transcriptional MerR regulator